MNGHLYDPGSIEDAIAMAKDVSVACRELAHTPYEEFKVGACVGIEYEYGYCVYGGCNVEFPGRRGIHAEQVAMCMAVVDALDMSKMEFIAVSCEDEGGHIPCGICMNSMTEFVDDVTIFVDCGDSWDVTSLKEEMPNAYGGGSRR